MNKRYADWIDGCTEGQLDRWRFRWRRGRIDCRFLDACKDGLKRLIIKRFKFFIIHLISKTLLDKVEASYII